MDGARDWSRMAWAAGPSANHRSSSVDGARGGGGGEGPEGAGDAARQWPTDAFGRDANIPSLSSGGDHRSIGQGRGGVGNRGGRGGTTSRGRGSEASTSTSGGGGTGVGGGVGDGKHNRSVASIVTMYGENMSTVNNPTMPTEAYTQVHTGEGVLQATTSCYKLTSVTARHATTVVPPPTTPSTH